MSHLVTAWLTRVPTPPLPAWPPLSSITPADWAVIDANTYSAVNGDYGSTHTPSANIVIGGAGVWFGGPAVLGAGSVVSSVTFGSNDYFVLPPGNSNQSRTLATPCVGTRGNYGWNTSLGLNSIRSDVPGCGGAIPLKVIDGAVLSSASLTYLVGSSHLPAHQLQIRIVQVAVDGTVTPLSGTPGTFGFVSPGATTAAGYYNGGAMQKITMALSARIDVSRYRYYANVIDEYGAGALAGNSFHDVLLSFTGILDTRPQ